MSSEACVHCALPSSITSALDPTLSTSQLVTIETFSPALCFSAHTNNYFYFYIMFLLLNFCINVLHRLIVKSCHPCLRINEDTIQYKYLKHYFKTARLFFLAALELGAPLSSFFLKGRHINVRYE